MMSVTTTGDLLARLRELEQDVGQALEGRQPLHGSPLARRVLSVVKSNAELSREAVEECERRQQAEAECARLRGELARARGAGCQCGLEGVAA